jgi:protein TonB
MKPPRSATAGNWFAPVLAAVVHAAVAAALLLPSRSEPKDATVAEVVFEVVALPPAAAAPVSSPTERPAAKPAQKPLAAATPAPPASSVAAEMSAPAAAAPDSSSPSPPEAPPASSVARAEPDDEARPLDNPRPAYPRAARQRGMQGVVVLAVEVDSQGRPVAVAVKQSSGFGLLDEAAMTSVKGWRFAPARRGNDAVQAMVDVPIRFSLSEG